MLVCNAYIWALFVRIYMRVCKKMVIYLRIKTTQSRKERKYTGQKTHVYRSAGMIASIRGKKPHVYRVIILKQMADHKKVRFVVTRIFSRQLMLRKYDLALFKADLFKPLGKVN